LLQPCGCFQSFRTPLSLKGSLSYHSSVVKVLLVATGRKKGAKNRCFPSYPLVHTGSHSDVFGLTLPRLFCFDGFACAKSVLSQEHNSSSKSVACQDPFFDFYAPMACFFIGGGSCFTVVFDF